MDYSYFTEKEDRAFTALVLEYNALPEDDDRHLALENRIKERTSVLLYLIPIRSFAMDMEDAGGFFLDIQKDIDWIIRSFRLSGLTYNAYLAQICRYRVMRYMRKKMKEKNLDNAMVFSEPSICYIPNKERCIPYSAAPDAKAEDMDLRTIIKQMVRKHGEDIQALSAEEAAVAGYLDGPLRRRRFISLLLSLPETETPGFIAGISRLLRTDIGTTSRFYMLRHEWLRSRSGKTVESLEMLTGRHWKIMMKLRRAIHIEPEEMKRRELRCRYTRLSTALGKRQSELRHARSGLAHSDIAELVGVSRSAVSADIRAIRDSIEQLIGTV